MPVSVTTVINAEPLTTRQGTRRPNSRGYHSFSDQHLTARVATVPVRVNPMVEEVTVITRAPLGLNRQRFKSTLQHRDRGLRPISDLNAVRRRTVAVASCLLDRTQRTADNLEQLSDKPSWSSSPDQPVPVPPESQTQPVPDHRRLARVAQHCSKGADSSRQSESFVSLQRLKSSAMSCLRLRRNRRQEERQGLLGRGGDPRHRE